MFYYPVITSPDQYCDYLLHATSSAATHTSLHWGSTWNMLTPLENLEPGEWKIIDVVFSYSDMYYDRMMIAVYVYMDGSFI